MKRGWRQDWQVTDDDHCRFSSFAALIMRTWRFPKLGVLWDACFLYDLACTADREFWAHTHTHTRTHAHTHTHTHCDHS
jgi:hypothetical protein